LHRNYPQQVMIHLRTRTGSSTAKDPSSFMGMRLMDSPVHPRSPCRLRVTSSAQQAPTAILEVLSPSPPLTTVWTMRSSQDDGVRQIRSTCYDSACVRALSTSSKPSASMTQYNPGPPIAKSTRSNVYSSNKQGRGFFAGPTTTIF